jgi:hypothetical protein
MNLKKQKLQSEVFVTCLDVLCRASATVHDRDPNLAADISQAIESLTSAIQATDAGENSQEALGNRGASQNIALKHDKIVDVLTNEVVSLEKS